MNHLDDVLAQDYVANRLPDEFRLAVDEHLTECTACLERVRSLHLLRDQFDEVWEAWSAAEHGRLHRQRLLTAALAQAESTVPSIFQRVRQHLGGWLETAAAGLSVNVLVDRTRRIACLAAGQLPPGCQFTLCPVREGVGAVEESARLEELRQQGSALLAQQRPLEALQTLTAAQGLDVRAVQGAVSELSREGTPVFRAVADGVRGRIAIKHRPTTDGQHPAFVLLVPVDSQVRARVALLVPSEGESDWIAEFDGVADGAYHLLFGPMAVP